VNSLFWSLRSIFWLLFGCINLKTDAKTGYTITGSNREHGGTAKPCHPITFGILSWMSEPRQVVETYRKPAHMEG
jgi:hypothetical protein